MSTADQLCLPGLPAPVEVDQLHAEREALRRRVGALLRQHNRLRARGDVEGASAAWVEANATEDRARALSLQIREAA